MASGAHQTQSRHHVLVADDSEEAFIQLKEAWQSSGMDAELHLVRSGEDALRFLRREGEFSAAPRPTLVILELDLPHKSGGQVLAEMQRDHRLVDLPVAMLTCSDRAEDQQACEMLGASAYLVRPHQPADLETVLGELGKRFPGLAARSDTPSGKPRRRQTSASDLKRERARRNLAALQPPSVRPAVRPSDKASGRPGSADDSLRSLMVQMANLPGVRESGEIPVDAKNKARVAALLEDARTAEDGGKPKAALTAIEVALGLQPDHPNLRTERARLQRSLAKKAT